MLRFPALLPPSSSLQKEHLSFNCLYLGFLRMVYVAKKKLGHYTVKSSMLFDWCPHQNTDPLLYGSGLRSVMPPPSQSQMLADEPCPLPSL